MYLENLNRRVMTHKRPKVKEVTEGLPVSHHVLEDVLSRSIVKKAFRWMTRRQADGECIFEKVCENYDRPAADFATWLRWSFPNLVIDLALKKAKLDKQRMKEKLFHHTPTVKALTLTAKSIGTYGLTIPQRFTAPLYVVWNVTQACNLSCRHCYQNATRRPLPDELTTAEKLNLIDQLGDEFVPFIAFAGGEPLVMPDLWPVLERCKQRSIHVTLATNGTLLSPQICKRLKDGNVKYVEVSVDSLNPQEHDRFRGQPNVWARTIQGIRNSVAAGIKTGMACCFTRENVESVDDMVKFAIHLGCKTFAHFNFIPVGRGREMMGMDLTPDQREILLRKLHRHMEEGKIGVLSTAPQFSRACIVYGPQDGFFAAGHAGKGKGKRAMVLSRYIGGCGSGRCYCAVQPDGRITPCVYIPTMSVGNIREKPFRKIWNNPLFDTLADREDCGDHCGVCDYRYYCGGCRARALAYTGDIQAGDPGCPFNRHEWEELTQNQPSSPANGDQLSIRDNVSPETRHAPVRILPVVSAAPEEKGSPKLSGREIRETETTAREAPETLRAADWGV